MLLNPYDAGEDIVILAPVAPEMNRVLRHVALFYKYF